MKKSNNTRFEKSILSTNSYGTFMPFEIIVFNDDKKNILTRLCKQRTSE